MGHRFTQIFVKTTKGTRPKAQGARLSGGKIGKGEKNKCFSGLGTLSRFSRLSSLSRILPLLTAYLLATDYRLLDCFIKD